MWKAVAPKEKCGENEIVDLVQFSPSFSLSVLVLKRKSSEEQSIPIAIGSESEY